MIGLDAVQLEGPSLHLLAGPNGSGKSTFAAKKLIPVYGFPFINADVIAAQRWPGQEQQHAYEASRLAAEARSQRIVERRSFITETVFSHPSKQQLVEDARAAGYVVYLHVMLVPEALTVQRVAERVHVGGHAVPEVKIRERYARLWGLVADTIRLGQRSYVYDNSSAQAAFRRLAEFRGGTAVAPVDWPDWTPDPLRALRQPG